MGLSINQVWFKRSPPLWQLLTTWPRRILRWTCEAQTEVRWIRPWGHSPRWSISGKSLRSYNQVLRSSRVSFAGRSTLFDQNYISYDLSCIDDVRTSCLCPRGHPAHSRSFSWISRGLRGQQAPLWGSGSCQATLWRKTSLLAFSRIRWAIICLQGQPNVRNWISVRLGIDDIAFLTIHRRKCKTTAAEM